MEASIGDDKTGSGIRILSYQREKEGERGMYADFFAYSIKRIINILGTGKLLRSLV
jgi:hypothetical protein